MQNIFVAAAGMTLLAAGVADATEPSIVAGQVMTPVVNVQVAPGQVELNVTVEQGSVGAQAILASITSPSGRTISTGFVPVPGYPATQKIKVPFLVEGPFFNGGLTLYSEPGTWTISDVGLLTNDGQFVGYSGSQLAALFKNHVSVSVANAGTPDFTPPTYGHGTILTPTVSLSAASPVFAVSLSVKDDISGVASVFIGFQPPSGNPGGGGSAISAPVLAGKVESFATLSSTSPTGTYTLTSLSVCDYAGNCVVTASASDLAKIFGATTFQVTN